jgi:voltage-gated potassium channel
LKNPFSLLYWFSVVFAIVLTGTFGFMLIEHYTFLDGLYMTIITITTIGYTEVEPLSPAGKVFNIFLILTSFSIFTYALAKLTQYITSGEMTLYLKTRKLMQSIDKLSNHVIVCGLGRNGQEAAHTLKAHKVKFVVIEKHFQNIHSWLEDDAGLLYMHADATEDEVLVRAGIQRAKALIITLPEDADNVFIVLSARSLNPEIQIISRASHYGSLTKLKKAGADNVIMPDKIGGSHMATLVSKPDVIEFIEYLSSEEGESISMESVDYSKLPPELKDQTLKVIMDWKKTGVNCIGVKTPEKKFIINPPENILITRGMKVIVLGTREQIESMKHNVEES